MLQTSKKILIIEDNESYITILKQKLSFEKFEVITAQDGPEGIQKVTDNQPDIVLIDLLLPGMNGMEVIEKIRQKDIEKTLPIIILTNINPDDEIIQKIMENKPAYYLIKPEVTLEDISEKIKTVLEISQ